MSTLEIAIKKIQNFSPEQLQKIIDYIEFIEFKNIKNNQENPLKQQDFFALAGIWEGRDITVEEIRNKAWGQNN